MLIEFGVQRCPHYQPHENRPSALEDAVWPNVPTDTTTDDPPQAVWQKIVSETLLNVPNPNLHLFHVNATEFNALSPTLYILHSRILWIVLRGVHLDRGCYVHENVDEV